MALVVAGGWACVAAAGPLFPAREEEGTVEAGYGAAFGRLVVVEDGKARDLSPAFLAEASFVLWLRSAQSGEVEAFPMRAADGRFHWALKPGEYVIAGMSTAPTMNRRQPRTSLRLWMAFSVPEPGRAAYIGDLHVEMERGQYQWSTADEYEAALKSAGATLAELRRQPVKALMRHEARVGTYRRVFGICAKDSGVECSERYRGLEATAPEFTADRYAPTADLRPLLEWKPSGRAGASYDVAIYDTFLTGPLDVPGAPRQRGGLVGYAENLAEPRFRPDAALEPGKKYLWSVRVRHGDAVSTWTTSSYVGFFVIGFQRGWNQWYGFETPSR